MSIHRITQSVVSYARSAAESEGPTRSSSKASPPPWRGDVIDLAGNGSRVDKRSELGARVEKAKDSLEQMEAELTQAQEAQDSRGFFDVLGGLFGSDGGIIMGPIIGTSIGKAIGSSAGDDERTTLLRQGPRWSWRDPD